MHDASRARMRHDLPSFAEFVVIMAVLISLTAFSVDNLLPAFGVIGRDFAVAEGNDLQLILYAYLIPFAFMQIVYGPLSDVIGRRWTLLVGLVIYAAGCVLALFSGSFHVLLIARAVQGMGAASARVLAVTVVRDCYEGREMARVMSFTMMMFIIVPIIAPGIGSLLLHLGNWHLIFLSMLAMALIGAAWFGLRIPETLHPEYRMPFSARRILDGFTITARTRISLGYATAMGLMMGSLMGYIGSAQQIFETEVYGLGDWFPVAFALVAMFMGLASFLNASLVRRLGMRKLSHAGLLGYTVMAALQLVCALIYDGVPPLLLFGALLGASQFLFSLTMPNFNAMAMEPVGHIAGTASSFIGFYTTLLGALLGLVVGQAFNGTVIPLSAGYLVFGLMCIGTVLWAEKGRLFAAQHGPARTP